MASKRSVGCLCLSKCGSFQRLIFLKRRGHSKALWPEIPPPPRTHLNTSTTACFPDLNYDFLWQVKDTESSITPKPFPDSPNDMIKDDILLFNWETFLSSLVACPFARSAKCSIWTGVFFTLWWESCSALPLNENLILVGSIKFHLIQSQMVLNRCLDQRWENFLTGGPHNGF